MKNIINVYSEIGELKKVLVHEPGLEIAHVAPDRLDELLFSAILEPTEAIEEHKRFTDILRKEGVEPIELVDLVAETIEKNEPSLKNEFINQFILEANKFNESEKNKIKKYLESLNNKTMVKKMISGITQKDMEMENKSFLITDPMPNLYFARDNFISIGDSIVISRMKYPTRQRETIFTNFIFKNHPEYKKANIVFERTEPESLVIEGGDVFIYSKDALVIGVSERTNIEAIQHIAKKLASSKENEFKFVYAINVPKMKNLMHLDTWLTMLDYDKFLYSPNALSTLKFWKIDLSDPKLKLEEQHSSLEQLLESIINKKPILIPVGGKNASSLVVDIETNFDATNYLVIRPGVVIGYDRNVETEKALTEAGIKVLSFRGNQLSLGMGSARCMSMPLYREDLKK